MKYKKEFKQDNPQTIGETDSHFDLDNYKDWLENKYDDLLEQRNELLESLKFCFRTIGRPVARNNYNANHYDKYFEAEALITKIESK